MAVSLAADLARALDPAALARQLGIEPDPWQARLLRSTSPRVLVNCSRQSGKSSTTALVALHQAVYRAPSLVLMISRALRQSQELFKKCAECYRELGDQAPAAVAESSLRIELENGSRIVSLPGGKEGDSIRGYSSVDLLAIDEAAFVPDALYGSVRPMLAVSGGRLIALSTPHGSRGWWYDAWHSTEAWERYRVPASECPRISAEFLEEERRSMGAWWFSQEYMCEFLDSEAGAFTVEDVDAALSDEYEAWAL